MAIRYKALTELYRETQRSVTAPDQWQAFLASACRNYRLSFHEQLLVFAQRPDATAVLEIERWNRQFGRWVNRGANGIAVFDGEHNGKPRLKYYFDISDTHEGRFPRPVPLWTVREEYAPDIIETLENSFGELEHKEDLGEALLSAAKNAVEDNNIMNFDLFNRVVKYIVENVGKTFSANAIAKFLKSEGRSLSVEAVYNYLNWLEKAFVIYRCQRYDLQGKSVLKTQEKFYLADASLKYCIMGFNPKSIAAMLENIVYFELRRRGYEVYIGKNETKEIDFVAVQRDERIYVQVCRRLPEESDREVANLLEIKDHYPKYVVTLDELAAGNVNGVKIVHLADFLLSDTY